ncbi:MAG: response regulator [Candidatus Thermoplasmatota archaeon]
MKLASLRPQVGAILVVDDEPDILVSLQDVLEAHLGDVKVFTASSGKDALAIAKKEHLDLVIADYRMPGMDGLDFLTKCRALVPEVPRILITAYPELDAAVRAINEAQIQNFLTKPIMPEALMQAVNAALVKGRAGLLAR